MVRDIWQSFRALPLWVRVWVAGILVPVNIVALAFLPQAPLVAGLAVGGMALNVPIMAVERGFSRAMAFPHLLCWIPLVAVIAGLLVSGDLPPALATYLWALLAVDLLSLAFDLRDALGWLRGDRAVAGGRAG